MLYEHNHVIRKKLNNLLENTYICRMESIQK